MKFLPPVLALAVAISAPGLAAAQSRGFGDLLSGVARDAIAGRRSTPATPNSNEPAPRTEAAAAHSNAPDARLDHTLPPLEGTTTLRAGFEPYPLTVSTTSGGDINAAPILGGSCAGRVNSAPNYSFTYTAGTPLLYVLVRSQGDTTLVVRSPNGHMDCSDDYSGHNPALRWDAPQTGTYHIWVGAIGAPAQANILITERQ